MKKARWKVSPFSYPVLSPWGGLGRGLLIGFFLRFQRNPCLKLPISVN